MSVSDISCTDHQVVFEPSGGCIEEKIAGIRAEPERLDTVCMTRLMMVGEQPPASLRQHRSEKWVLRLQPLMLS